MISDKRRKAFHYRHAAFHPNPLSRPNNLQEILERSKRHSLKTADLRCFYPEGGHFGDASKLTEPHIFISRYDDLFSMLFMEIMYVEPGNSIPIFATDYKKETIECESLPSVSMSTDGSKEYLESLAFVAVFQNHVLIMQSKAIGIKDIEEYFDALLRHVHEIQDNELFTLQAHSLTSNNISLTDKKVKNVSLLLPLANDPYSFDSDDGIKVLSTLIGEHRVAELRHVMGADISELQLEIAVGYKYNTSPENQKVLSNIAQGLVDAREEGLTIDLKGSGRIVGDQLQIKTNEYVPYENALPVRQHVYEIMATWLVDLIEKGLIEP
ncbi:hypothetical protein [Pseudomonas sp. BF-R-26]|uniref:hypothetical protein n=1 Tax=Pseudomonas sp. BF-R-26 TaxID=2832398 RepID=UPI001CBF0A23|nr:hypothetical protein [Pseudomonas sp. BF-R-26]